MPVGARRDHAATSFVWLARIASQSRQANSPKTASYLPHAQGRLPTSFSSVRAVPYWRSRYYRRGARDLFPDQPLQRVHLKHREPAGRTGADPFNSVRESYSASAAKKPPAIHPANQLPRLASNSATGAMVEAASIATGNVSPRDKASSSTYWG